jgi:hypothetical protein
MPPLERQRRYLFLHFQASVVSLKFVSQFESAIFAGGLH